MRTKLDTDLEFIREKREFHLDFHDIISRGKTAVDKKNVKNVAKNVNKNFAKITTKVHFFSVVCFLPHYSNRHWENGRSKFFLKTLTDVLRPT